MDENGYIFIKGRKKSVIVLKNGEIIESGTYKKLQKTIVF